MIDRDDVVYGLLHCRAEYCNDRECPYYDANFDKERCRIWLHDEALKLIQELEKAQEPRVMTLEEVRDNGEVVYLEKICGSKTFYLGAYIIDHGENTTVFCSMASHVDDRRDEYWDDYGKTWRCWSSRPTDEQRRAVKWE